MRITVGSAPRLHYPTEYANPVQYLHLTNKIAYFWLLTAPVDGHWGRWSDWRPCDAKCDDGIRTRFRNCDNPTPMHGGKYCVGKEFDKDVCVINRCHLGNNSLAASSVTSSICR